MNNDYILSWCVEKSQTIFDVKSSIVNNSIVEDRKELNYRDNRELYDVIEEFPNYAISCDNIVNLSTGRIIFRFSNTRNYRVKLKDKDGNVKKVDARKLLHFNLLRNPEYKLDKKYPRYAFSKNDIIRIEDSRVIYMFDSINKNEFIYLKNSANKYVKVNIYKLINKLFSKEI